MKLKEGFIVHQENDESLLVPVGDMEFSGLVRGNNTLGVILELLKNETTEEALIAAMKDRFEAPEGAIENDVKKTLDELRKIGALEE